jgi:hypothetical protein
MGGPEMMAGPCARVCDPALGARGMAKQLSLEERRPRPSPFRVWNVGRLARLLANLYGRERTCR